MTTEDTTKARIYRFHESVAVSLGDVTSYLGANAARAMAHALERMALDVDCIGFANSTCPSISIGAGASSSLPETMQVAVLSTCHLTEVEGTTIDGDDWPTHTMMSKYSMLCYVGGTVEDLEGAIRRAGGVERWPAFQECALWARSLGFDWIRFDADADEVEVIPVYEW